MKKHLKQLLIRSFDYNLTQKEQDELQRGFADFPELVQEKEDIFLLRNVLQKQTYLFYYGFSEKIMRKIETSRFLLGQNLQDYFAPQLNALFRWVASVGTVAIVVLVIALYFTQDSASINTLTPVNDISFNDAIILSFYNYK